MEQKIVKIRFKVIEANRQDYEEHYSHLPDIYIPIWRKKTVKGFFMGARLLVMVADDEPSPEAPSCANCLDKGVLHTEKGWIPCKACGLGLTVLKYYTKRSKQGNLPKLQLTMEQTNGG